MSTESLLSLLPEPPPHIAKHHFTEISVSQKAHLIQMHAQDSGLSVMVASSTSSSSMVSSTYQPRVQCNAGPHLALLDATKKGNAPHGLDDRCAVVGALCQDVGDVDNFCGKLPSSLAHVRCHVLRGSNLDVIQLVGHPLVVVCAQDH